MKLTLELDISPYMYDARCRCGEWTLHLRNVPDVQEQVVAAWTAHCFAKHRLAKRVDAEPQA